ncbi:RNase P modulator RnpM [Thermobrachium celere]|uniref:RNase P modulator RnpM n=1 Tax=Thermobrachium celere TaxID=53422 RepID=UPI0035A24611
MPQRMCLGCMEMKPKKELIRVVRNKEGEVKLDLTGKAPGRGAYICRSVECFEKAYKGKKFEKALEVNISPEVYEKLKEELQRG